ncbi:MAG TPA: flagellar assembly protein FliX [Allosphingosinicella sp.]
MRITGYQPIRPRDIRGPQERAGFSVPAEGAAPAVTGVQPLTSVGMLVAIAEADDESERRRRAVEQASAGLDALEALETGAEGRYEKVAEWAQGLKGPAHPELAPLVRDIELRALVELAKAERGD